MSKVFELVSDFVAEIRKNQNKRGDYLVTCSESTPLKEIVKKLASEHVHRIFVVNEDKSPVGVVSQSDIITEVFA
jgi:CBS domain containing-hemolysin-like protein